MFNHYHYRKLQTLVFGICCLLTQSLSANMDQDALTLVVDKTRVIVHLTATSNGCTRAIDFAFSKSADGELTATRIRKDRCRRRSFEITFEYPLTTVCAAIDKAAATADESPTVIEGTRISP